MARPKKEHRVPPLSHPFHHPLWENENAETAFKETLRKFWDADGRRFEEWRLWLYWYELLEKCLKD